MAQPSHPATPPGDIHSTPTLPSPLSPPLPKTPHVSLTGGTASKRLGLTTLKDDIDMSTSNIKGHEPDTGGDQRMSISPPPSLPERTELVAEEEEEDDDDGFLPQAELERMEAALSDGSAGASRDELAKMLQSLLDDYKSRIPFLQNQIEAQRGTILALNQQSHLSRALYDIERDRFAAERASWQAETQALIRTRDAEAAAGKGPKRVLDLDVGYHQELEAVNKRLEMDNRLMAPRLVDTQKQIESLVNELRLLRTHVILDSSQFEGQSPISPSSATARTAKPNRSTMGDARAEHLLLAAKKVRTMRKDDKSVGRLTLDELQRRGVVGPGGGVGYSEGYGGVREGEDELQESDEDEIKPIISPTRRGSKSTPLLPRTKKLPKRPVPSTPSRNRGIPVAPQTTPGGNFSDLLIAAELATRPGTPSGSSAPPSRVASSARYILESPSKKRRRQPPATIEWSTRRHLNEDGDGSPRKSAPSTGGTEDSHEASALDLLAQASQDVAQGSQSQSGGVLSSAARLGGAIDSDRERYQPESSRSETPLGPAIDLDANATPARSRDNPFVNPGSTPGALSSPIGGVVPGIGKYVHLSSSAPARRARSPYIKWTREEDELLTRAVMEHGEKWDLVSKCVPTRSYHQVRQRWLRKIGAFDKKPAMQTDPSPLGRSGPTEQGSPTPKGRKRHDV